MSFSRHATIKQLEALQALMQPPTSANAAEFDAALRSVTALEAALGVTLVEGSRPAVRLTAAGFAAARRFGAALARLREGVAALQQAGLATSTQAFRFGAPWWIDLADTADAEAALLQASGCASIDFSIDSSTECCKRVRAGQLDAALVVGPVEIGDCLSVEVAPMEGLAAVPAGHPLARRSVIDLRELAAIPAFAMFKQSINPDQDRHIRDRFRELGFVPQKIIRVADAPSMLQMVAAGKASAVVNALMPAMLYPAGIALRPLSAESAAAIAGRVLLIQRKDKAINVTEPLLNALRKLLNRRNVSAPSPAAGR